MMLSIPFGNELSILFFMEYSRVMILEILRCYISHRGLRSKHALVKAFRPRELKLTLIKNAET